MLKLGKLVSETRDNRVCCAIHYTGRKKQDKTGKM